MGIFNHTRLFVCLILDILCIIQIGERKTRYLIVQLVMLS